MNVQVKMELVVPAVVRKKGTWYVSSCPLLDVHSQGRTEAEARRHLVEALVEFLLSCYERGTLNTVLRDAGFEPAGTPPVRPRPSRKAVETIKVPLPFVVAHRAHGAHLDG